jgi:coenzyme F420-reducing hydrogenase delta subunit
VGVWTFLLRDIVEDNISYGMGHSIMDDRFTFTLEDVIDKTGIEHDKIAVIRHTKSNYDFKKVFEYIHQLDDKTTILIEISDYNKAVASIEYCIDKGFIKI